MEVITVFVFRNSLFCSGSDIGSLSTKSAPPLIGLLPVFNLNLQSSSLLLDKFMQRKGLSKQASRGAFAFGFANSLASFGNSYSRSISHGVQVIF